MRLSEQELNLIELSLVTIKIVLPSLYKDATCDEVPEQADALLKRIEEIR